MANKKVLLDTGGKVKEVSSLSIDTDSGSLVADKFIASTASFGSTDGLLTVQNGVVTVLPAEEGKILTSDGSKWITVEANYVGSTPSGTPVIGDLDPNTDYPNPKVLNLSNVKRGTLKVANGGTGISNYPASGEVLLIGNGTPTPTMLNALSASDGQALHYDGSKWTFKDVPEEPSKVADVQIFSGSGLYTWNKPANTKYIRVLAHGGGGGGGSGANRADAAVAMGGGGGGAGGFVNETMLIDSSVTTGTVIVGAGGLGALTPATNSSGLPGGVGNFSSFGIGSTILITADGGAGGNGGLYNSAIATSGGVGGTTNLSIYDNSLDLLVSSSGSTGASSTVTTGSNSSYLTSSSPNFYGAGSGAGAGGASLFLNNYERNYPGGNAGSTIINGGKNNSINALSAVTASLSSEINLKNTAYVSSGGGGGASSNVINIIEDDSDVNASTANIIIDFETKYGDTSSIIEYSSNKIVNYVGNAALSQDVVKCGTKSAYLNGSTTSTGFTVSKTAFGTGNFTIEAWVYPTASSDHYIMDFRNAGSTNEGASFAITTGQKLYFGFNTGGINFTSSGSIALNEWTHIALVRSGSLHRFYINGVADPNTLSSGWSDASTTAYIGYAGYFPYAGRIFKGYLDRYRVHTSAIYTSNFTPKTTLYRQYIINENIDLLKLDTLALSHFNNATGLINNSSYKLNMITGSYSSIVPSPVGLPSNLMPDGVLSSSYNAIAQPLTGTCKAINAATNIGTSNFTAEGWYYLINTGSNSTVSERCDLMVLETSLNAAGYALMIGSTGVLNLWDGGTVRATSHFITGSRLNSWNHIAFQRTNSSTCIVYVNGTGSTVAVTANRNITPSVYIGSNNTIYNPNGYIKEFKLSTNTPLATEIQNYYNAVINGQSGSFVDPSAIQNSYLGGIGSNGLYGSGGGGGGASTNYTGSQVQQGGNGGDGYVAIVSYK